MPLDKETFDQLKATMTVDLTTVNSADTGIVYLSGTVSTTPLSLQIGTNRGTTELTFANTTSAADIRTAINAVTEVTGVSAAASVLPEPRGIRASEDAHPGCTHTCRD